MSILPITSSALCTTQVINTNFSASIIVMRRVVLFQTFLLWSLRTISVLRYFYYVSTRRNNSRYYVRFTRCKLSRSSKTSFSSANRRSSSHVSFSLCLRSRFFRFFYLHQIKTTSQVNLCRIRIMYNVIFFGTSEACL